MLCEGEYKYIRNLIEGETEELYHMGEDPEELVNLAQLPAHQETLNEFRVQAIDELRRTKAGMVDNLPAVGTPVN
jgi:arylsulfatase A-like enzyme